MEIDADDGIQHEHNKMSFKIVDNSIHSNLFIVLDNWFNDILIVVSGRYDSY